MKVTSSKICDLFDLLGSMLFLTGSVLFLSQETVQFGTWLFVGGSLLVTVSSAVRLVTNG